jgi:hypothetical protein
MVMIIFAPSFALFIPIALFGWWRMLNDVQGGVVKVIRGEAHISEVGLTIKVRVLKINNKALPVEGGDLTAFEEGRTYIVYCSPRLGRILSAELVDDESSPT